MLVFDGVKVRIYEVGSKQKEPNISIVIDGGILIMSKTGKPNP
jgi:hypothetical protein